MLEARATHHAVDIGYVLAPRLWRRGLMSEAVAGLVMWAMGSAETYRVRAVCDVDNVSSAVHPNVSAAPRDCLCYAIVKPVG
jgi:ribosomal-protein-alanine N-acetyltransferase